MFYFSAYRSKNVSKCVPRPEKREKSPKTFENLPILANFMNLNHILKKVGRGKDGNLFSIFNLILSESTCSGVSKIRNDIFFGSTFGSTSPSA
jgi:hypothetical protein